MIALLLALAAEPAAAESQATLQSCDMTPGGWVCHYQMPSVTLLVSPDGKAPVTTTPTAPATPPAATLPVVPPVSEVEKAEAARQARLVANCADAKWLSLCLPADRREARRLRDEMSVRAALRTRVTGLLSEAKCDEAVKTALAGGDLPLAREARDFCTR
ncbi:MAG: hypothetical protein ACOYM5_00725 [Caulobacter sp.]|jgi:hypothetical protein